MSGQVNAEEWAKVVAELLQPMAHGKKSQFAKAVGVDVRTVTYWLAGTNPPKEANVLRVAELYNLDPIALLARLGALSAPAPSPSADGEHDDELADILAANVDDVTKQLMIERLYELRKRDKERRQEEIRWHIGQSQRRAS